MADKETQALAAKSRIISHMNKDHSDSVISSLRAYDGKMTDISLEDLTLSCHGKTYRIPLNPRMSSYREARERVVELDKECRKALNQSDVTVKDFLPPTGLYALEFLVISATFLAYGRRSWFAKGQIVESVLGPSFAAFSWSIQPWLIGSMLAIHTFEAFYFARNRLRKHSVNARSPIWWLFMASCFIEGQFLFRRFDAHVRVQRGKQKH
ncbi:uncharacterized protein MYCFIDRAFT_26770 [Pseudocercospora fijiensis CIRAD86]|uniref:DUF2470 domain-containing protein n=1 Tax=Pseudocercospora fijiensis (strain CIRAD86) TaxID=383855 RepID=N1QAW9_PSEFD|nr:uncharacterized protein MYCFIDRAFT_26770 [Pseudocercospora fijiensis CIRAD86]EME88207.1 hypothetical protein MYCFIDRAFT_26770 [Pseudocercospora fijiensis CIRAD86]